MKESSRTREILETFQKLHGKLRLESCKIQKMFIIEVNEPKNISLFRHSSVSKRSHGSKMRLISTFLWEKPHNNS